MQIWIHDNKMKKITALNNDIPDMLSYTNSTWHPYLDQATSTFDFTIPKFSNGELHEDIKLINDECFVSFYVNGSYQVFYIATLQEDDFNIQLTCNNTNLEYALEYANPFNSSSAQSIEWYLNHMDLLSFAAVEIGNNEISDRKRTLTFDSQETKMARLQSLMSNFDAEFEFKTELNRDGTYKRIAINIYQKNHIGTDRKDVVLYYSNGLKGVQVTSDKTQMFNAGVFDGKDGVNLANVEFSEKNADGVEEFYSRKGDIFVYAPLSMQRYPATMKPDGQDNWIRKDFQTEYENVNDLKAYALRTLKQYAYPLVTYTASVQSGFVRHYTDSKLGDTIRIIDKNFVGGLALEARVSEMIISFDNPANNSFVFTNYRKLDNKPSAALQTRIEQVIESRLYYRIELATTGGVTFKNNEGETIIKPSLYKGNLPWTKDVTWHWTLNSIVTDGMQYRIQARDITDTALLTVDAFVSGNKVATTEITLTNINDGPQGPQGPQGDEGPQGDKGDTGNGIANTVVTYGLSVSDTTEPATWSSSVPTLVKGMYLWIRTVIIYTNGESTTSYQISYIAKDADATAAIDKTKQELLEKLDTVRNDSLAAVEEAKQELTTVADDLSAAKQDLTSQAQQLTAQANAQSELTKRVSSVEETANGTKTTVSELSKTVDSNTQNITSVTARTKTVEDDLTSTKTTLSQVKTTADNTSKKTATLETGLNGVKADLTATTTTANTTKTNLANYQASNDKAVANLQSNLQTANGNISSLQTKVEAVPGQITSAVSAVEGKILTSVGGRNFWIQSKATGGFVEETLPDNHVTGQKKCYRILNNQKIEFDIEPDFSSRLYQKVTFSAWVKYENVVQGANGWNKFEVFKHTLYRKNSSTGATSSADPVVLAELVGTSDWKYVTYTYDYSNNKSYDQLKTNLRFVLEGVKSGTAWVTGIKVEIGSIPSDYSPAPEDTVTQISNLSSRIQQTADGMTLLATKTELNSAKTELQSGITTATNKANAAQNTANSNAQTISTHTTQISALNTGLSAKVSQTDFNTLSGRVTTAENNITAKANELSSKITTVEGKIPTSVGGRNYLHGTSNEYQTYTNTNYVLGYPSTNRDWNKLLDPLRGKTVTLRAYIKNDTDFPVRIQMWFTAGGVYGNTVAPHSEGWSVGTGKMSADWASANVAFTQTGGNATGGTIQAKEAKLEIGNIPSDWSPAPEDYDSKLATAQSEIKQTTDAIKASVSSLDSSTVKSASLTINTDGIVMKAGKSTTDVANAIGSYFAVNQNAINLFADKIKVKGNMIVAGAITGDKIAANSINSSKIVSSGITANVIKGGVLQSLNGSTNFELDTGKLFYNNNNTGVFRVQNGASTMGLKFSNTSVTVNGTSRILSRTILGGDRRETTLDDGKWDKGGFSGLVIETIKGVEPATNEHADAMRVISDNIYFTHTYSADSPTGISAHGWKMETYAPDSSYSGNIVLKPYGINYRQSDIIVGDVRLDNGDGSGYWMRATINTLKNCFGHILNGGTSSQALNAIRSELNKISGI
jgi:predicted  nucleic acid-binding Zn-ribbon protein